MNLLTTNHSNHRIKRQSESGYIMLMSLIILSVISIMATSLIDRQMLSSNLSKSDQVDSVASKIQQTLTAAIYSSQAWQDQTAADIPCAKEGQDCTDSQVDSPLQLKDTSGTILADSTSATAGFDRWGLPCNSYDSANGNDLCPFKYDLTWSPVFNPDGTCPTNGCPIRVLGNLQFKPASNKMGLINPTRYQIDITRGRETGSLQEMCTAIKGVFDQVSGRCTLPNVSSNSCAPGFYLMNAPETGEVKCLPLAKNSITCPAGSGAVGYNADGSLNCRSVLEWL